MSLVKFLSGDNAAFPPPEFSPNGSGRSIAFAGSLESMSDNNARCKHLRNKFTVMVWAKQSTAAAKTYLRGSATDSLSNVHHRSTSATLQIVTIRAPGTNTVQKDYSFTFGTASTWHQAVYVVDRSASNPTNEQLIIYVDGVKLSPSKLTDTALSDRSSFTTTNGLIDLGSGVTGNVHSMAIWDKVLKANEVVAIYNSGVGNVNLLKRKGNYRSQKSLRHWWVFEGSGPTGPNMGRDYGRATSEHIDYMRNQTGITAAADLVIDAPGY